MTKDDSAERKTLNLVNKSPPPPQQQQPVSEPTRGSASILADWPVRTDAPWQVHQEPNTAVAPTRPEITAAGTILTGGGERKSGRKKSKRSGRKAARTEREEELQRQRQETGSDGSRQAADVIEPEEFLMSGAYPPRTEPEPGPGPGKPAITAEGRLPGTHWPSGSGRRGGAGDIVPRTELLAGVSVAAHQWQDEGDDMMVLVQVSALDESRTTVEIQRNELRVMGWTIKAQSIKFHMVLLHEVDPSQSWWMVGERGKLEAFSSRCHALSKETQQSSGGVIVRNRRRGHCAAEGRRARQVGAALPRPLRPSQRRAHRRSAGVRGAQPHQHSGPVRGFARRRSVEGAAEVLDAGAGGCVLRRGQRSDDGQRHPILHRFSDWSEL